MISPFLYFVDLWWNFFTFAFCIYLFVFTCSNWKNFMNWS